MSNKAGNIFEQHLDKILMIVVGVISLILLFRFFIAVPYKTEIRGKTVGPASIDKIVYENASKLSMEISQPAKREKTYTKNLQVQKFSDFMQMGIRDFNDARPVIDTSIFAAVPSGAGAALTGGAREYQMPKKPVISNAKAGLFRCVGYVPAAEVNPDALYGTVPDELADVDLVSVQAELDYKSLADSFNASFASRAVKEVWRDSSLAEPVFAAVELERQQLNQDGSWSDWQKIGFTKINNYKKLLTVADKTADMETANIQTLIARLGTEQMRNQILQPAAYDYVYPDYDWISPEFEKIRQEDIQKEKELARRAAAEKPVVQPNTQEKRQRQPAASKKAAPAAPAGGMGGMPGMGGGMGGGGMGMPAAAQQTVRPTVDRNAQRQQQQAEKQKLLEEKRQGKTTKTQTEELSPEEKFLEISIDETTKLNEMDKIVFWAHDDSAVPGAAYRYRIKLAVVNPLAGKTGYSWIDTNSPSEEFIFWSNYAESEDVIKIPQRTYIFATDVKRQADKTVSVEVAKYNLGNWNKEGFLVRPGETIGGIVEKKITDGSAAADRDKATEKIDFSTGSIMLDIFETTQWAGRSLLSQRSYSEFIYSDKDGQISKMPAKKTFWSKDISAMYLEIEDAVENPVSLSGSRQTGGSRTPKNPAMPGGGGGDMMPGMGMPGMGMPGMPGMGMPGMPNQ